MIISKSRKSRRLKRLFMASGIFCSLLRQGVKQTYEVVRNGLPKDARVVYLYMDHVLNDMVFVIESKKFEKVKEGNEIPIHTDITVKYIGKNG